MSLQLTPQDVLERPSTVARRDERGQLPRMSWSDWPKARASIHRGESTPNPPGCPGEAGLRPAPLHVETSVANRPGCPGAIGPRPEPRFTEVSVQLTSQDVLERSSCGQRRCTSTRVRPTTQDVLEWSAQGKSLRSPEVSHGQMPRMSWSSWMVVVGTGASSDR